MAELNKAFPYPPLPPDTESIRILCLAAGRFSEKISCSLHCVSFEDRPRYAALSYTWGYSHLDTAQVPLSNLGSFLKGSSDEDIQNRPPDFEYITIDDELFYITHNLYLVLLHLRSPYQAVSLWIDAICINQNDDAERNLQVSLMSEIYTTATRVLAWVGIKNYPKRAGLYNSMAISCGAGDSQHAAIDFAAATPTTSPISPSSSASSPINTRPRRYSQEPDTETLRRITSSAYWTRLWIVQETHLAHDLDVVFGAEVWPFERLWQYVQSAKQDLPECDALAAMEQVAQIKRMRYHSTLTLENLIERFSRSGCQEPRDHVFGVLGCAVDVQATISEEDELAHLQAQPQRRGIGLICVDYVCPYYTIWANVVNFCYFQAEEVDIRFQFTDPAIFKPISERKFRIVRTAAVVQNALGQKVADEFASGSGLMTTSTGSTGGNPESASITATGYIAGTIGRIGAQYTSLIRSSKARQDWRRTWYDYYKNDVHQSDDAAVSNSRMETLRRIDDEYMVKLRNCDNAILNRIQDMYDPSVVAHMESPQMEPAPPEAAPEAAITDGSPPKWTEGRSEQTQGPVICVGTNNMMGLVSSQARPGDVVVRFWNCDTAIVMRRKTHPDGTTSFVLIGVADVANVNDSVSNVGRDVHAEQCITGTCKGYEVTPGYLGFVHVKLGLRTLQTITANTTVYGPQGGVFFLKFERE